MDQEKGNSIVDALLSTEREKSKSLVHAGLRARGFMDRLRTGVFTLGGAYVGWRFAWEYQGLGVPPLAAGVAFGLFVAVFFSGSQDLTSRSSRHRFVASSLRLRYASAKLSPLRDAA